MHRFDAKLLYMYILERSPLCPNDRTADRVDRMGDAFTATCTCIVVNNDGFVIRSPCSLAVPNEILLIGGVKQAAWESCQRQRLASQRRHRISPWENASHTIEADASELLPSTGQMQDHY
ncbi:hypothetical protein GQ600_17670 [Phytophthora cactorum]|nr:hypothetical protein GQ600_17670 [Phytophthora cactorum]